MRIIIKLKDEKTQIIDNAYHKIQGFVYKLMRDRYSSLHDKKGYKFFCFSNIFPFKDETKNLIISSPSEDIIESIASGIHVGEVVNIGEMQFRITGYNVFKTRVPTRDLHVVSSTPIMIRIPESKYDYYNIPFDERKSRYVYWRPKYSFEAFVKQLSENLIKKFNDFYGTKVDVYDLFEQFLFKEPVYGALTIDGRDHPFAASLWDFLWGYIDSMQRKIIEFGIDTGFGERNSLGFGFMNVVK